MNKDRDAWLSLPVTQSQLTGIKRRMTLLNLKKSGNRFSEPKDRGEAAEFIGKLEGLIDFRRLLKKIDDEWELKKMGTLLRERRRELKERSSD